MKRVTVNGVSLAYGEYGTGSEAVVLSHSYLVDRRQFEAQIRALSPHYRVLAFDHRGHGDSDRTPDYAMASIYADAVGFIEATGAAPCHFVGLSTGGFVGLRLALRRPDLLRSLVLMDTSAEAESRSKRAKYTAMFTILRRAGFGPVIEPTMKIMFGPNFLGDPDRCDEVGLWRRRIMANDVDALIGFGRAIFDREPVLDQIGAITVPTLVVVGEHDQPQPIERSQALVDRIPGARLTVIADAGHLCTIENPTAVSKALLEFLANPETSHPASGAAREPRSVHYDGRIYATLVEPLLDGVHTWVLDHLPEANRVLEACCGTGALAHKIAASGREVVAVDLSPRNIDYAKGRAPATGATFDVADASRLPYEDAAFDIATVVMSLHEMSRAGQVAVLRELARVAARVLIVDFSVPRPRNMAGVRNVLVELAAGPGHFTAFRRYTRLGGLDPVLTAAKLSIVEDRTLDSGALRVVTVRASG
jgi:pimeloyl-ACP methyl ester carboxylesterase